MSETIKLKPGDELVITIPKNARANKGGAGRGKKKRGPISKRSSRDKYLPRRKSAGLINFYDVGQIFDLDTLLFRDNAFPIQPDLLNAMPWRTPLDFEGVTLGEWTSIAAQITGVANRKDRFKKIEKSVSAGYGIQLAINEGDFELLNPDNPKFLDGGYKTEGGVSRLRLLFQGLGFDVDTDDSVRITSAPLYSADSVSFGFNGKANVFIAPALGGFFASGVESGNFNWAGTYYDQFPRELLSVPGYGSFFAGEVPGSPSNNALLNYWLEKVRTNALNRYYFTIDTDFFFGGGAVPDAGAGLTGGSFKLRAGDADFPMTTQAFGNTNPKPGTLLLIVDAGARMFYIWSDENRAGTDAVFAVFQE